MLVAACPFLQLIGREHSCDAGNRRAAESNTILILKSLIRPGNGPTNRIRILSRIDNPRVHAFIHTNRIAGMLYS